MLVFVSFAWTVDAQNAAGDTSVGPRVALVIGNSAYTSVTPLPNPANDAEIIAEKLWESGFEVIESIDADRETMLAHLATFRSRLRPGSEAVVYYAGHGVRIGSTNYLLPVSVSPSSVEELKTQSIDAQLYIDTMNESGAKLNIILLDACRNNPFDEIEAAQADRIATRALSIAGSSTDEVRQGLEELAETGDGGLAEMSAGDTETLISFATAPGAVALDGEGRHSPYTQAIADNIDAPGLEIGQLFRRVRGDVRVSTGGSQITWTTSTLESNFYFKPPDADARGATTGMATATDTLGALPPRRIVDRTFWRAIRESDRVDAYEAYIRTRPDGAFVDDAKAKIAELGGDPDAATRNPTAELLGLGAKTRGLNLSTEAARADVRESLERADISLPIGTSPTELPIRTASTGWVWVPEAPRLGVASTGDEGTLGTGSIHWVEPGEVLEYQPLVGSNGGVDVVQAQFLKEEGQTEDLEVEVEVFVHACDMLAGMPQDSRRVTAGARQFIVNRNFDAAIVACELAVEEHPEVPRYWAQLARAYRAGGRYEEALEWQQKAVDADYLAAVVNLGQMYLDAQAVPQDYARAFELFSYAAGKNETAAYTALAWVYRAGVGQAQDFREALAWYRRGANAGNDWAMTNIGELYQNGKGVERNPEEAVRWYTAAAQSGELTAQTRLARMYQTGDGIPRDFDEARFWFETAAGRGVPNALTRLGIMYENGQGQEKDIEAAVRLYTRAAAEGDEEALFRLGKIYASKHPLYDDPFRAAGLLEIATSNNVYGSHRELARLYEAGRGVEKDHARAVDLFQIAADGNPWAARDVGRMLAGGDAAVRDVVAAREWFERAADNGVNWAARDLARLYEAGNGVEQSPTEALIWYAAATAMSPDANLQKLLDEALAPYGTPDVARAAQTLLNRLGYDVGTPDGQIGPRTRNALGEAFAAIGEPAPGAEITVRDLGLLALAARKG